MVSAEKILIVKDLRTMLLRTGTCDSGLGRLCVKLSLLSIHQALKTAQFDQRDIRVGSTTRVVLQQT